MHYDQQDHDHDVTIVLVETSEAFVDSLICNFNVHIYIAGLLLVLGASKPKSVNVA